MKHFLTLLFIVSIGFTYGQQLSINDRGRLTYYNLGDNEIKFPLRVRNHDSLDHRLKVEVEPLMASGHEFQFCWDVCYGIGHTYSLDALNVPAGDSMGAFTLYFRPNRNSGVTILKVTFFDEEDPDVRISHTFRITQFGVTNIDVEQKAKLAPPSPNPASSFTEVHFDLPAALKNTELRVYNLIGKELERIPMQAGTTDMQLDVRGFRPGIYFLYLHADGKPVTSQKLIVNR